MGNEVQQMTVGVTLEFEKFQQDLTIIKLELAKLKKLDLGIDANSIKNINKVLKDLSGTINSVAKGSSGINNASAIQKTGKEIQKVNDELKVAAKAVKEYHASFDNLLNTSVESKFKDNLRAVENAFSKAKKAMADAKLDAKSLGTMPIPTSTFDIKQNIKAYKEQLASVGKINSKLQAQFDEGTKATATAQVAVTKQVQQVVQESAKAQTQAINQTVTDEKLRQSVVNQTRLLLTELRKIVAALGESSKKSTSESTQGYEQQGKVVAELTAKIDELAKTAVQAEQTKQAAVNQTTKAYESQQMIYERLRKNVATSPSEAAYNANQQALRKTYNNLATRDMGTPVSEYMNVPYHQAVYSQIQSALQGKEFQKLLGLAPTDKRTRFDERAERWAKAVDSLTDVMPATVAALKSATWNPYASKEGYFNAYNATYARKPRKGVAEEEAGIRATLASMEHSRIDNASYQKKWDKYINDSEVAQYREAWKKAEREKSDNAKLVADRTKQEVRQYNQDCAELEKLRKERIKQEAKALAEKEKENAQARQAYRKAYEDAYYSTGVGAGVRANREGQGAYSKREVEKMLADMPAHVQNRVQVQRASSADAKLQEQVAKKKEATLAHLEDVQKKYYDKVMALQNEFQKYSEQGVIKTSTQWRELERRYESHVKAMEKIADMANKIDPTGRYANSPNGSTAGRIENMALNARYWQQFTPENRLKSNRAARQSMLDSWDYFGNDQGFSAQLSQLRRLKEAAWLDYKQGGALGDPAMMEKSFKQLAQAKTIEQQLVKYMNEYNSVLGTTETTMGKFTRKLHSHLNWITAGATLGLIFEIPHQTISSIIETDEALHNLGTVMQSLEEKKWDESLGKWVHTGKQDIKAVKEEFKELSIAAAQYGASNKDVLESARLWGRMYKDQATVNVLTAQSAKLAVADNFSVAESTKAVEAAMFQFGIQARNATEALAYSNNIIDVYTKLSHNAGVSAQDLARGVERSGAVAHQAGMDFEFLTALIAEGTRATALSGQEIGNMIKTLIGSFRDKKSVAALQELGITITEIGTDGKEQFRSVQDVLLDVAVQAQATNLDLQKLFKGISGGKFQWSKAAAMFSNYEDLIKTWGMAVDSKGFTDTQVMTQMDSISRRAQQLKTDLESLVVGGSMGGLAESIKSIVTGLDHLIKFLDGLPSSFYTVTGTSLELIAAFASVKTITSLLSSQIKSFMLSLYQTVGAQSTASVSAQRTTAALLSEAGAQNKASVSAQQTTASLLSEATAQNKVTVSTQLADASMINGIGTKKQTADVMASLGKSVMGTANAFGKLRIGARGIGSLLVGGITKAIPQLMIASVVIEGLTFVLDKLKESSSYNEDLEKQTEETRNLTAAKEQELQVLDEQEKFADSLMRAHQQLTAAIEDNNTSEEKRQKLINDRMVTEEELAKVVGQAAVDQMQADGWTQDSIEATRKAFKQANNDKRQSIQAWLTARQAELIAEYNATQDKINQYKADKEAYINGVEKKIEGLSLLQKAELAYWNWQKALNDARASRAATGMGSTRSQMARLEEIINSDTASEQQKSLAQAQYNHYSSQLEGLQDEYNAATNGQDWAMANAANAIFDPLIAEQQAKLNKLREDSLGSVSAPTMIVPNVIGGSDVGNTAPTSAYGGKGPTNPTVGNEYTYLSKADALALKQLNGEVSTATKEFKALIENLEAAQKTYGATPSTSAAIDKAYNNYQWQLGVYRDRYLDLRDELVKKADGIYDGSTTIYTDGTSNADAKNNGMSSSNPVAQAVINEAQRQFVDPILALKIAQTESGMGSTTSNVMGYMGNWSTMEENIRGGITSIRKSLDDYGGDIHKALQEYNTGDAYSENGYADTVQNMDVDYYINKVDSGVSPNMEAPNLWDYIVYEGGDIDGLTDLTKQKAAIFAKNVTNRTGVKPRISSAKRNGDGSSWHDSGQAFDIDNDEIFDENYQQVLREEAQKVGLIYLREVTADEQRQYGATGPNIHFSDHGDAIPYTFGDEDKWSRIKQKVLPPDFQAMNISKEAWNSMDITAKKEAIEANKGQIAHYNAIIKWLEEVQQVSDKAASLQLKYVQTERKRYEEAVKNAKAEVEVAKKEVEYRENARLAQLGLAATQVDKDKAELAVMQVELEGLKMKTDRFIKKNKGNTQALKEWRDNINKEKIKYDEKKFASIANEYKENKTQYETDAKNRDLKMGDMQDGMNWFNTYGVRHANAVKDAEAEVKRLQKKLDDERTKTTTKNLQAIKQTENALLEAMQKADKVRHEYHNKAMKGLHDIAEQMIFEGKNASEIWQNLWTDLGKDSLKILMHQDVGEGSFLTQLLGMAKTKDDINRLKPNQEDPNAPLSTDLANNATSVEQAQAVVNSQQNIANVTHQKLDAIIQNTAPDGEIVDGAEKKDLAPSSTATPSANMPNAAKDTAEINSRNENTAAIKEGTAATQTATAETKKSVTDNTKEVKHSTMSNAQLGMTLMSIGGLLSGFFGKSKGGRIAGALFSVAGMYFGMRQKPIFGKANGGWFDNIPKFANGGVPAGRISGAGTGRSDSILAYLANKDKFVMLSNGEYVINEKSAKALGYDTLDRLNHYADGGVLNPTPYVPQLNPSVVNKTLINYGSGNNGLSRQNGTSLALMEEQNKMMAEQNNMLKNAGGQQGASQIVVLNTHASSDDVMRALQENPRLLQAMLGKQSRMGFR